MSIGYEVDGQIATITIDRPEALNAMDTQAYEEISAALREIDADPEVRVGVITGAGERAFSAGADLKEMHGAAQDGEAWRPWRPERWDFGLGVSKPLIAAIDGYALAGGLELALKCDIRIATPESQFGCPEVKWNLLHGFGALRLPAVVGLSNAMVMLLTGQFIDADTALRNGLVSSLVPRSELMDSVRSIAEAICDNAADAVNMTKELTLQGIDQPLEQGLRLYAAYMHILEGSEEQSQRTRSFAERHSPDAARS